MDGALATSLRPDGQRGVGGLNLNETERGLQTARGDGLILRPMSLDWFASGTDHHFLWVMGRSGNFQTKIFLYSKDC